MTALTGKPMTLARWIASGGGIGFFPIAPGTAGSLLALLIGAGALSVSRWLLLFLVVAVCVIGTWAVRATGEQDDPGWIVIDEFAGQWIALLGLGRVSAYGVIAAFVLFRVLDIAKPGPVGWADRQHGAIGVMADDVVAGMIVAAILFAATGLFPVLR